MAMELFLSLETLETFIAQPGLVVSSGNLSQPEPAHVFNPHIMEFNVGGSLVCALYQEQVHMAGHSFFTHIAANDL